MSTHRFSFVSSLQKASHIESVELKRAASGRRYIRVLEELDGVIRATPKDYVRKFFDENAHYAVFQPKALDVASRLPIMSFQMKNPRTLASACIYVASIEKTSIGYRPLTTQAEVAEFFKVTTVSVRNAYKGLVSKLREMNTILSIEEIDWWQSFEKEQSERA